MKSKLRLPAIAIGALLPVLAAFAITLTRQQATGISKGLHKVAETATSKNADDGCNCDSKSLPPAGQELQTALSRSVKPSTYVFSEAKGQWVDTNAAKK